MSGPGKKRLVALGCRAFKGGGAVVGVSFDDRKPRVVCSTFLATAVEGDRLSFEPYQVASEMKRGPHGEASLEAAAAVAEGRKRQDSLAAAGLDKIKKGLRSSGSEPVIAALLINRAGWMTDLLAYSLAFPDHPPVAEGLAVRKAFRFALGEVGLKAVELDEKSLSEQASKAFDLSPAELDVRLKALGIAVGRPWRKEQKLACLAAWVAIAPLTGGGREPEQAR